MSTLRINNIEAQSIPASPTIDEKVKVTNSSGDILVNIDGKTSGITTIGINTTDGNIKFDANSNVLITGILTATTLAGNFTPDSLEIGSNIKLGNAGVVTATSFVSSGAISGTTGTFTGDVNIVDSIIHSGDADTKIRFPAADQISFETSGTEYLKLHRYSSVNFVEVGASAALSLANNGSGNRYIVIGDGNASSTGALKLQAGGGSTGWGGGITMYSHANTTNAGGVYIGKSLNSSGAIIFGNGGTSPTNEYLRIDSSGRIGVGVVPTAQYAHNLIQIGHQATLGANAALSATGQTFLTHNLYFDTGGTLKVFNTSNANEGAIFRLVDGDLLFSNSAATTGTPTVTERLRINSAGNLTQTGSGNIVHYINTGNNSGDNSTIAFGDTADVDAGQINYDHGTNAFQIRTNGASNSVVITNEGEMQLSGDANPVLSVNRGGSNTTNINIKYNGSTRSQLSAASNGFEISAVGSTAPIQFFANGTEKVRIPAATWGLLVTDQSSTGNTGGYQTSGVSLREGGDSTFVISGAAAVTMTRKINAGKVLDFYSNTNYAGGVYVNGQNSAQYQSTSDYRLKEDITSMTDGIDKVKLLNPVYYKNKQIGDITDTTTVNNGFLAHEVQSVIPTLVDGEKDGNIDERGKGYQTLNYAGFAPTAIAAIKELIAKVETLEAEVAALKSS